jgi:hypothetical protein
MSDRMDNESHPASESAVTGGSGSVIEEVGGPRVFEVIGLVGVLECLPRQRLINLAVTFGLWNGGAREASASPLESLTKLELVETMARRKNVSARAVWYALTPAERIAVIVHATV